jgi:hypothetical protein
MSVSEKKSVAVRVVATERRPTYIHERGIGKT